MLTRLPEDVWHSRKCKSGDVAAVSGAFDVCVSQSARSIAGGKPHANDVA